MLSRKLRCAAVVFAVIGTSACRTPNGEATLSEASVAAGKSVFECRAALQDSENVFFRITFPDPLHQGSVAQIVQQSFGLPAAQFSAPYSWIGLESIVGPNQYTFDLPADAESLVVDIFLAGEFSGRGTFSRGAEKTALVCKTFNYPVGSLAEGASAAADETNIGLSTLGTGEVIAIKSSGADAIASAKGCDLEFHSYIYDGDDARSDAWLQLRVKNDFGMAGIFGESLKEVRRQMPPYQDLVPGMAHEGFGFKFAYDGSVATLTKTEQISDGAKHWVQASVASIRVTADLRSVGSIEFSVQEQLTDEHFNILAGQSPVRATKARCAGGTMQAVVPQ